MCSDVDTWLKVAEWIGIIEGAFIVLWIQWVIRLLRRSK